MKRALLVGAALATLLFGSNFAGAQGSLSCSVALSVHNDSKCTAEGTIVVDGPVDFTIDPDLGPAEGLFSGDIQVTLQSTSGLRQMTCAYRATAGLAPMCLSYEEGDFLQDPVATCSSRGSGIGSWTATCLVGSAGQ